MHLPWITKFFEKIASQYRERLKIKRNYATLMRHVRPQKVWAFAYDRWFKNDCYLIECLGRRDDIHTLLEGNTESRTAIVRRLKELEHTYRKQNFFNTYPYDETPEGVHRLTMKSLLKVYLLLNALENKDFCKEIGELIEADLANPYSEHGGLVELNEHGRPHMRPIESARKGPDKNTSYTVPQEALEIPHIARFHVHATSKDNTKYAGPSQGMMFVDPGDLSGCDSEIIFEDQSHNFVITKLGGKRFNIDYYGGEKTIDDQRPIVVLDLGNYDYV